MPSAMQVAPRKTSPVQLVLMIVGAVALVATGAIVALKLM
jgi:hypothetical protein